MWAGWENCVCSVLRKESIGETLSSCSTIYRVATRKMEIPFFTRNHKQTRGYGYKLLLGRFWLDRKRKKNCQLKQSALGIIFAGKWWIPQGWIILIFSRTDYWAIFSGLRFCQERLYWMILEVPSNLVFYYSIFYGLNKKCDINGLYIYLGR